MTLQGDGIASREAPGRALATGAGGRLLIIDGLRGVAAMLVVVFHLSDAANIRDLPAIGWLMAHGNFGVEIFFVISGFVITYSVRNAVHTGSFFGRFALRRSIRLDPPYWTAIIAEIVLLKVSLAFFPDHKLPMPTAADVVAHVFYAQTLLGRMHIVTIFWTLCYEIQFYLFMVGTLVATRSLALKLPSVNRRRILIAIGAIMFVYSIAIDAEILPYPLDGLFVDRWYQFSLGIVTLAFVSGWLPRTALFLSWAVVGVFLLVGPVTVYTLQSALTCVGTSMLIVLATRTPSIERMAARPSIQFLGKISYSLYLIHAVIGWRFVSAALRLMPIEPTVPVRIAVFLAGVGVSVVGAYVMFRLIELPSRNLASRIAVERRRGVDPAPRQVAI